MTIASLNRGHHVAPLGLGMHHSRHAVTSSATGNLSGLCRDLGSRRHLGIRFGGGPTRRVSASARAVTSHADGTAVVAWRSRMMHLTNTRSAARASRTAPAPARCATRVTCFRSCRTLAADQVAPNGARGALNPPIVPRDRASAATGVPGHRRIFVVTAGVGRTPSSWQRRTDRDPNNRSRQGRPRMGTSCVHYRWRELCEESGSRRSGMGGRHAGATLTRIELADVPFVDALRTLLLECTGTASRSWPAAYSVKAFAARSSKSHTTRP